MVSPFPAAVTFLALAAGAALALTAWIALRMRAMRAHVTRAASPKAGLTPLAGLGLPAARLPLAIAGWLAVVAATAAADVTENAAMAKLLHAGPDQVHAGRHDVAIGRMRKAARLKFTRLFAEFAAIVALWAALLRA